MTIKIIAAKSANNVIGKENSLPFSYPCDMKFFRTSTLNSTIIMGKKTYESIGSKSLPKRENIVISRNPVNGVMSCASLQIYFSLSNNTNCWIIGGGLIYKDGMQHADEMYITETPDIVDGDNLIYFPEIDLSIWKPVNVDQPDGFKEANIKLVKYIKG